MALYFSNRSPFDNLTSKFTKRIEADSILVWFQKIWRTDLSEEALYKHFKNLFGTHFYGLVHFAYNLAENKPPIPSNIQELEESLRKYFYVNNIKFEEGKYLEILTDDDELSLAWYLIEEEYARRNSKRFLYLIQEDWKLPLKFSAKKSGKFIFECKYPTSVKEKKQGVLYMMSIISDAGDGPIDKYPTRMDGIRLPDLIPYLTQNKINNEELHFDLIFCKMKTLELGYSPKDSFIDQIKEFSNLFSDLHKIYHEPIDELNTDLLCGDYQEMKKGFDQGFEKLMDYESDMQEELKDDFEVQMHGNEHIAQLCIQGSFWKYHPVDSKIRGSKIFDQILLFDDLWVNANYELANSLVNFYTKWSL